MLYTLDLAATDPGDDTITSWAIDWGDGTPVDLIPGNPATVTHTFADGTAPRTITATATDEDGAYEAAKQVSVNNVIPTVGFTGSSLNLGANGQPIPFSGVRGQPLNFAGTISDPGFDHPTGSPPTSEAFTYVIEWGDGTSTGALPASVAGIGSPGVPTTGAFSGSHVYPSAGTYQIMVKVEDDDGGETSLFQTVTIATASMQLGGDLTVGGTQASDVLFFLAFNPRHPRVITLQTGEGISTHRDVSRIVAFGQGGNDVIAVAGNLALPVVFHGGPGNDQLIGGRGHSVLDGGPGNDFLLGGQGRDLLIGGTGADRILGNSGDDLLIAGSLGFTDFDVATAAIMAEWTSEHDLPTRMANLLGKTEAEGNPGYPDRLNDAFFLELGTTVREDEDRDVLTGASGNDWFFFDSDLDKATDLKGKRSRGSWRLF
jgi:Ca2+-binding RTX toxin-like protein